MSQKACSASFLEDQVKAAFERVTASSTGLLKTPPALLKSGMRRLACIILPRFRHLWTRHLSIVRREIMRDRNFPLCFLQRTCRQKIQTPRSSTVVSVSYVGSVGRHLLTFEDVNPGNPALCLFLSNPANLSSTTPAT